MSLGGYPSLVCFNNMACQSFEKTSWRFISDSLKLRYRLQQILSEAESTIVELNLDIGSNAKQDALSPRIRDFEVKLDQLEMEFPVVNCMLFVITV